MLSKYITYDKEFLKDVFGSLARYQIIQLDDSCILLENVKYRDIVNHLINIYSNLALDTDFQEITPKKIEAKVIHQLANDILISILPKYKKQIEKYDDLIYCYEDFSFQESNLTYHITDQGKIIPQEIELSEEFNEYTPGVMNYEKIHVLIMKKIVLKNFPAIYMELLSMLLQKITNYQVEENFQITTTHIIDEIVRAIDNQKHISLLDVFREIDVNKESTKNKSVYHYLNLKANDYLLSDWYSDFLFQYYLEDSKKMQNKLNQVFQNDITVQELLDYYQISLENPNMIPMIEKKLTEVKKYSIKR